MRTQSDSETRTTGVGVGAAAKQVSEHARKLVGLELELAKLELSRKLGALGIGVGLLVGAAVFGLYAIGFLFATIAAALANVMDTWLALLLVTVFLLAIVGILVAVALAKIKRGSPPVPKQAIHEAKLTTAALKGNGKP